MSKMTALYGIAAEEADGDEAKRKKGATRKGARNDTRTTACNSNVTVAERPTLSPRLSRAAPSPPHRPRPAERLARVKQLRRLGRRPADVGHVHQVVDERLVRDVRETVVSGWRTRRGVRRPRRVR